MRRTLPLLLAAFALGLAGCGGGDDEAEAPSGTTAASGDAIAGAQIFSEQGCGNCHTLQAAGTSGTVGPNLDDAKPSFDAAVEQIRDGGGAMPAFGDKLSDEEIANVAAYVVESTKG